MNIQKYYNLSYYGLYIYDYTIECQYFGIRHFLPKGIDPTTAVGRAFFILDTENIIDENKHQAMFYPLWYGRVGSVYLIRTDFNKQEVMPNILQVLDFLNITDGFTANIYSKDEMNKAFKQALSDDLTTFFSNLHQSKKLINIGENTILSSRFGRFCLDNPDLPVYFSDIENSIDILATCMVDGYTDLKELSTIFMEKPSLTVKLLADNTLDTSINTVDISSILINNHHYIPLQSQNLARLYKILPVIYGYLLFKLLPKSRTISQKDLYYAYNTTLKFEKIHKLYIYREMNMPFVPMPMCVAILGLLGDNQDIYCPQINLPLISIISNGFVKKELAVPTVKDYINTINDKIKLINNKNGKSQLAIFTNSYLNTYAQISFTDNQGNKKYRYEFKNDSYARAYQALQDRVGEGVSIFIIATTEQKTIGLNDDLEFARYITANFLSNHIVDLADNLFYHDKTLNDNLHYRLYVIGNKREPSTSTLDEYLALCQDVFSHSKPLFIQNYHSLYQFTNQIIQERLANTLLHSKKPATEPKKPINMTDLGKKDGFDISTEHNLVSYNKAISDDTDIEREKFYQDEEYDEDYEYNNLDSDELSLYAKMHQQNSMELLEPDEEIGIDEPDDFEENL